MGKGWKEPKGGKLVRPVDSASLRIGTPDDKGCCLPPPTPASHPAELLAPYLVTSSAEASCGPPAGTSDDKYRLYQESVQSPDGDLSYIMNFHRQYLGGKVRDQHWLSTAAAGGSGLTLAPPCCRCRCTCAKIFAVRR